MPYEEFPENENVDQEVQTSQQDITASQAVILGGSVLGFLGGAGWAESPTIETASVAETPPSKPFPVVAAEITAGTVWGGLTGFGLVMAARIAIRSKRRIQQMRRHHKFVKNETKDLDLEWALYSDSQD